MAKFPTDHFPHGVRAKAVDWGNVVLEFELQSLSDNSPWEKYGPPYPPIFGLDITLQSF